MKRVALLVACIASFAVLKAGVVMAEWSGTGTPEMRDWFRGLRDVRGISCCDISDGHRLTSAEFRQRGNTWQVVINGIWRDIPPERVLDQVSNPTGTAVVFYNDVGTIFCFVRPPEF